ncbi:MAG TPA: FecR domain-containing protein [Steroidobacteraceae bacterium]|nr:FecR domain-containing protein [Steroidobacteraceae bacterium]
MNSYRRNRKVVAKEAAGWFVANRKSPDARQREKFDHWLRESPDHVAEYLGVSQVSRELGRLEDDPAFSLDTLLERVQAEAADDGGEEEDEEDDHAQPISRDFGRPARGSRLLPVFGALVAVAAAGLVAVVGLHFFTLTPKPTPVVTAQVPRSPVHISTGHGEQLTRRLADGSVIHLNSDTEVIVAYSSIARDLSVKRGQAVFEVVHDASRPFHVDAGPAAIVDIGTRFDVYVQGESALVTVLEGRVSVKKQPIAGVSTGKHAGPPELLLGAGEQVRIDNGALPDAAAHVDAQQATAWLRHEIAFEHQPLGDVVAEFNRYNRTPIEVVTPELRTIEISGVFAQDDTDSFIVFLRSLDGVGVEVREDRVRVYRR